LLRSSDLEARLVAEAGALMGGPMARPTHVSPAEPGTFGQGLARHLPPFERAVSEITDERDRAAFSAVLRGERPLHEAPPVFMEQLVRLGPDLDGVLRATHAAGAALEPAEDGVSPCPGAQWTGFQQAARLAGLRARLALARGDAEAGLRDGLDGLALGRDAAIGGGLLGRMVGGAIAAMLTPVVAETLANLPEARQAEAVERVRALRDAIPPFEATMRHFVLEQDLMMAQEDLPAGAWNRLPPRAQAVARSASTPTDQRGWFYRLGRRAVWRLSRAPHERLLAASVLTGARRDEAFQALAEQHAGALRLVERIMLPPAVWAKYSARSEAAGLRLDLVVLAGAAASWRSAHGSWPGSVAALAGARLLTPDEAVRLGAARLEPGPDDRLAVTLALPHFDPDPALEARLRLPAPSDPTRPP